MWMPVRLHLSALVQIKIKKSRFLKFTTLNCSFYYPVLNIAVHFDSVENWINDMLIIHDVRESTATAFLSRMDRIWNEFTVANIAEQFVRLTNSWFYGCISIHLQIFVTMISNGHQADFAKRAIISRTRKWCTLEIHAVSSKSRTFSSLPIAMILSRAAKSAQEVQNGMKESAGIAEHNFNSAFSQISSAQCLILFRFKSSTFWIWFTFCPGQRTKFIQLEMVILYLQYWPLSLFFGEWVTNLRGEQDKRCSENIARNYPKYSEKHSYFFTKLAPPSSKHQYQRAMFLIAHTCGQFLYHV